MNIMKKNIEYLTELKKLNLSDRNKVRSILALRGEIEAIDLINNLRKKLSWQDLLQIERALRSSVSFIGIPQIFPKDPQTEEKFTRLVTLSVENQLKIINALIYEYREKLDIFSINLRKLNKLIILKDPNRASELIKIIYDQSGYSHFFTS